MAETVNEAQPEKPIHELLTHALVDVYVGSNNTHWVLHEKLLCYRSTFFSSIFYKKGATSSSSKIFGLPDEEDAPFRLFVGWLYSSNVPTPEKEEDLTDLYDLYLMGEKWSIAALVKDVLNAIRRFYRTTDSYPSLRRVQYIYANTTADSPLRQLLVGSIARMLVVSKSGIPDHWGKALVKNGQLAVDLIRSMQEWNVAGEAVPDPRVEATKAEQKKVEVVERLEKKQEGKAQEITNGLEVRDRSPTNLAQDNDSESTLHE
ncbi:uncharacterized protein PV09_09178 [Verruconis gallopava]|uniref:BTB domain-containing protein n=1 Tax=Verruconis gallopava TaxID=253628 RepID=A0A0D2AJN8_9PEZI|nr:uncharacterized protein PV09_09178 [Verruconis gallopava]KIV99148.1 hypothetical protein PV09_09178 [Verruconis gallopava]